jgi:nitrate reductase NapE component
MTTQPSPTVVKPSFARTVKAVAWSFLGIRKNSEFHNDAAHLSLFHIIAVGLVGALLFVVSLIALVNWVVAK